jgi:hypothetical protein
MAQVGAHVGSVVRVTVALPGGGQSTSRFRVVGAAAFPPDFGVVGLDRGAIFTVDGFVATQCPSATAAATCTSQAADTATFVILVGTQPGPAGARAVLRYARQYPDLVVLPVTPANLVNFGEAVDFPRILELALLAFGVAMLLHVLGVSVTRRRRESALLKSLGFLRRQVAAGVCWQAVTVAVVALAIGVPIGIVAGRTIWHAFARNLGVVPVAVLPTVDLLVLAAAVLAGTVALAVVPALVSARGTPAAALRDE